MGSGTGYELAPFDPYAKQPKMSYKVSTPLGMRIWSHMSFRYISEVRSEFFGASLHVP